jgi:hypothetical protein
MKPLLILLAAFVVALAGAVIVGDEGKSNRQMRGETISFIVAILVTIAATYFVTKP